MKPKHFPRLWCALAGVLPLHPTPARPHIVPTPPELPVAPQNERLTATTDGISFSKGAPTASPR